METLPKLLLDRARRTPSHTALREKVYGVWNSTTWKDYAERVGALALGFHELGVRAGDRVAIIGDNRPFWVIAELAVQSIGAIPMGLYQDSVADEIARLVAKAGARVVVAEDQEQVDKLLAVKDAVPTVERVLYDDPRGLRSYDDAWLLALQDALRPSTNGAFEALVSETRSEQVALLATTSGTTADPKLAMLSHANLLAMARSLMAIDPLEPGDECVSFLPLAWLGEQMVSVSSALSVGFAVSFPEEPETATSDLREIGPQVMFSPPRIWEGLVSEVMVRRDDATWFQRRVIEWALRTGDRTVDRKLSGKPLPTGLRLRLRLADATCLYWIRDALGLARLKRAYTGGAALGPETLRFFHAIGVNLKQIYGQTEVSGISVVHRDGAIKLETMGEPLPGSDIRIADDGEILTRSDAVFQGYFENDAATREALVDGWLHSGDAGYLDDDGHLVVIDRKQDVTELPDGTRFSPQFLENKLKFSPYVKEAVVFGGHDRSAVTALLSIDFDNVALWAEKRKIAFTTFTGLSQHDAVLSLARDSVEAINETLPDAMRIRRFLLLHKELHADDAELTRTRKVRRRAIEARYRPLIDALYGDAASVAVESEIQYQDGRTARMQVELRIVDTE